MPNDNLIYDILNLTSRDIVSNVEKRLSELRGVCKSNEEFVFRTRKITIDDYDVYFFDKAPAFFTHFWIEDLKIHWTLQVGEPPIDWRNFI